MKPTYKKFLDRLRKSGTTNMLGAVPFLQRKFGLTKKEAGLVLSEWINSFQK